MSANRDAQYWKQQLGLISHIEGGAYKEVYRSGLQLPHHTLTISHTGDRAASTSIYFLLERGEFSAFHRIASDEIWHFYDGDGISIYEMTTRGELKHHKLGLNIENGEQPQIMIPSGSWFGSRVEAGSYCLCGCTVAPGFDFADFELADRNVLIQEYPQYAGIITELTRI
ncbi:MAG: cupin domain-containing protein [Bacteroidetes bacterium]|nr:cupin domain-containing protein [Bacteroidota bacterium]